MGYITNSLSQGEEIKLRAHLHWYCFFDEYIFTLFTIILIEIYINIEPLLVNPVLKCGFIGLIFLESCWVLHRWSDDLSIDMVITNRRVIYKKGILAVTTSEILTSKIESVTIEQSVFGRIFGFADLHFSGTGTAHVAFYNVNNPQKIKSEIEYIISEQEKR